MKNTARKFGFTLVELMIVVAIIGLLVALAIPKFVEARNRGRARQFMESGGIPKSNCISNVVAVTKTATHNFCVEVLNSKRELQSVALVGHEFNVNDVKFTVSTAVAVIDAENEVYVSFSMNTEQVVYATVHVRSLEDIGGIHWLKPAQSLEKQ